MTTEITTRGNNQLATTGSYEIEGMEGFDQSDVILPRYTIVQPTSQGKGDVQGVFHNNLTSDTREAIDAVILKASRSRTLWSGDLADKSPECSSYDGVTGKDGKACADCIYNRWAEGKDDKTCRQGYMYLCYDPADDSMFLIGAMGTSVKPAKILNSVFAQKNRSPFSALTRFATKKIEDPAKGKYWILECAVKEWLDNEKTAEYRSMYQAMQSVSIHEVETTEAEPEDSSEPPF